MEYANTTFVLEENSQKLWWFMNINTSHIRHRTINDKKKKKKKKKVKIKQTVQAPPKVFQKKIKNKIET